MHIASLCGVKTKPLLFPPLPAAIGLTCSLPPPPAPHLLLHYKSRQPNAHGKKNKGKGMKKTRERNAQLKKTQSDRETATIEEDRERNAQSLINPKPRLGFYQKG